MSLQAGRPTPLGGPTPLAGKPLGISPDAFNGYAAQYTPGTYTFTPPSVGRWKFVGWGAGGADGYSGAYGEITRPLTPGQPVTIVVGRQGVASTTITFSDGRVCTAGNSSGAVGVASGFDVNLSGSAPGSSGTGTGGGAAGSSASGTSGAGAPANLPFRGGQGADNGAPNWPTGGTPGAGGNNVSTNTKGGDGMVIVLLAGT